MMKRDTEQNCRCLLKAQFLHEEFSSSKEPLTSDQRLEEKSHIRLEGKDVYKEGLPEAKEEVLSFGDKLVGFAAKAAKIAGGAVVAPVALAAVGAAAAYEAITRDEDRSVEKEMKDEPSSRGEGPTP
ncbi:hypothetical protein KIN20_021858 [Parelaphostrongylus tenuis]|uniref:Uncharacterized protein n=1 Tax=Parelaphostrongylus tenuis TaxID=148309 RepID=A0AAD5QUF5_PARTN|nr:hypothetical protein KIN20_021858 [Parelaphostrongylus tenuis]